MTSIREPLEIARAPSLRWAWWLVACSGFALALPVALGLGRLCHFTYHDSGVISALTRLRYPKQMDLFYYAAALAFVPACTAGVVFAWLSWCGRVGRATGRPIAQLLRGDAVGHVMLWPAVGAIGVRPDWPWPWIGACIGASVLARLALARTTWAFGKTSAAAPEPTRALRTSDTPGRDALLLVLAAGICIALYLATTTVRTPWSFLVAP